MTRPLPAYIVRPIKRRVIRRSVDLAMVQEVADGLGPSVRADRLPVKQPADRERPGLRVLTRE